MKIPQNKQFNVGIYTRLSKDDYSTERNGASLTASQSIENQIDILTKYVHANGWNLTEIYSDDGYVGSNFERPAFTKMIEDAKSGRINLIIAKDLSRIGRDAVGVGMYTEELFPNLGIRFVTIVENIDTFLDNNEFMPFYAMMHDYYLKDMSKKIKQSLHSMARAGKRVSGAIPYGYRKSEQDSTQLMIDEEGAEVIKMIFELRLQRKGFMTIARILNENGILSPTLQWNKTNGKTSKKKHCHLWTDIAVKRILQNEVYTGKLIQMKTGTLSHKNKKLVSKDKDEWIVVENAHEAIISQERWDEAQCIDLAKNKNRMAPQESLFKSLLKCDSCGSVLASHWSRYTTNEGELRRYRNYYCYAHHRTGRVNCSPHSISENELKRLVKEDLLSQASKIKSGAKSLKAELQRRICSDITAPDQLKKEIVVIEKQLADCEQKEELCYEDKVLGRLSETMYDRLMAEVLHRQDELNARLTVMTAQKNQYDKKLQNIDKWIRLVKKYANLQEIDRAYLEELIDCIEIGEKQVTDGQKHQHIKIIYKFVGYAENETIPFHL